MGFRESGRLQLWGAAIHWEGKMCRLDTSEVNFNFGVEEAVLWDSQSEISTAAFGFSELAF